LRKGAWLIVELAFAGKDDHADGGDEQEHADDLEGEVVLGEEREADVGQADVVREAAICRLRAPGGEGFGRAAERTCPFSRAMPRRTTAAMHEAAADGGDVQARFGPRP
jgi:hypothetical protein